VSCGEVATGARDPPPPHPPPHPTRTLEQSLEVAVSISTALHFLTCPFLTSAPRTRDHHFSHPLTLFCCIARIGSYGAGDRDHLPGSGSTCVYTNCPMSFLCLTKKFITIRSSQTRTHFAPVTQYLHSTLFAGSLHFRLLCIKDTRSRLTSLVCTLSSHPSLNISTQLSSLILFEGTRSRLTSLVCTLLHTRHSISPLNSLRSFSSKVRDHD
jgi:hypothetical protein